MNSLQVFFIAFHIAVVAIAAAFSFLAVFNKMNNGGGDGADYNRDYNDIPDITHTVTPTSETTR